MARPSPDAAKPTIYAGGVRGVQRTAACDVTRAALRQPVEMAGNRDNDAPIQPYDKPAGGWDALKSSWQALCQQNAVLRGPGTLLRTNQPAGFHCPGCAWSDRYPHSTFEFCENGVKAVANEATSKRATAEFFAEHSDAIFVFGQNPGSNHPRMRGETRLPHRGVQSAARARP